MARIPATERRAALARAALAVIARDGVHAATTRAIVAEAGMSLASFHYAVASRDELLRKIGIGRFGALLPQAVQRALHRIADVPVRDLFVTDLDQVAAPDPERPRAHIADVGNREGGEDRHQEQDHDGSSNC